MPLKPKQQMRSMQEAATQGSDIDELRKVAAQKAMEIGEKIRGMSGQPQIRPQIPVQPRVSPDANTLMGRANALQEINDTDRQIKQQALDQLEDEAQFGELSPEKQQRFQQLRRLLSGGQQ